MESSASAARFASQSHCCNALLTAVLSCEPVKLITFEINAASSGAARGDEVAAASDGRPSATERTSARSVLAQHSFGAGDSSGASLLEEQPMPKRRVGAQLRAAEREAARPPQQHRRDTHDNQV